MKIALPIWRGRVSPVFDTASRILVVEYQGGREVARDEHQMQEIPIPLRLRRLSELGVNVLICGAISRSLATILANAGITVVPFITGAIEEVLSGYLRGRFPGPRFFMPGCYGRRRRFRIGRGFRY
jgi:predicted Fe-Mo cluster-binding NifX family protein